MSTVAEDRAILDTLRSLIRTQLHRDDGEPIEPETRFFADLGLASIDAVVLGEALQSHYRKVMPFADLMGELGARAERDLTIGELMTFLKTHIPTL